MLGLKIINTFKIFDEDESESLTFKELFFCLRVIFNVLLYDKSIDTLKKDSSETVAYSMNSIDSSWLCKKLFSQGWTSPRWPWKQLLCLGTKMKLQLPKYLVIKH